MAEHCGYIVKVEHIRPHSNADRLQIATFFGNDTIVDLKVKEGDIGVYFPSDIQLSEEFCNVNDLVRRKDENGNQCGGYLEPGKRNVRVIKLRGEKSDGMYLPLTSLANFTAISELHIGDKIDILNGVEICRKYIPMTNYVRYHGQGGKVAKKDIAPTFYQHVETEQLAYNLGKFHAGDVVELTLKMHGTSSRVGYVPVVKQCKQNWLQKLMRRPVKEYTEYGYVVGTRRVVLGEIGAQRQSNGFYESDDWRYAMARKVEGKLNKGEIIYGEIVGFQGHDGQPIMASASNKKMDKEFVRQYGDETVFSYGCNQHGGYVWDTQDISGEVAPCCELYVYRMVMVNEDGDMVEYSPDQMRYRCEQMGVKCVPLFERFIIPEDVDAGEYVIRKVEQYFDGPDPVGKTHVREGVVARIVSAPNVEVYKHKNFNFKLLTGIAKENADVEHMTEDMIEEL